MFETTLRDPDDILTFGNGTLKVFSDEFNELEVKSVEADEVVQEFAKFKVFWLTNVCHLPQEELWPLVLKHYAYIYPSLVNVWQILLIIPVFNTIVERGFSNMGCVKTDYRKWLSAQTLELLTRISIEGCRPDSFNPMPALNKLFETPGGRHPDIQP